MSKWLKEYYPHLKERKDGGICCEICRCYIRFTLNALRRVTNGRYIKYGCREGGHTENAAQMVFEQIIAQMGFVDVNNSAPYKKITTLKCTSGHIFRIHKKDYYNTDRAKPCPKCPVKK